MNGKRAAAFFRTLPRHGWVLQGALLALMVIPASTRAAPQTAPQQMLYFTMPLDPLDTEGPTPLRVTASWLELPDLRHGQILRLSWWTRVAPSHAARFALDYVGLERGEDFQYGGGRATFGWTSRLGGVQKRSLAIDLDGNLPTGDPELHPLSARAPMARLRVRASVIAQPRYQVWLGWSAQRVSPPSDKNREVPLDWFASVSAYEIAMRYATPIADAEFSWRFDTGV